MKKQRIFSFLLISVFVFSVSSFHYNPQETQEEILREFVPKLARSLDVDALQEYRPALGYVLNGLFVTTILLLIANIMDITLFPPLTQGVKATGRMIRDYLPISRWDEDQEDKGRSIITDETTEDVDAIADMVKKAVDVFSETNQNNLKHDQHQWTVESDK